LKGLHRIDLGQWPQAMYVTDDKRTYNRFIRERQGKVTDPFPPSNGGNCQMMTQKSTGSCIFLIAVGPQDDAIELATTLAHEATHAMRWLLEHVGEDSPGTETQAYLVEHIVREGLKALTKVQSPPR
jgi:hypothetical protein